MSGPLRSKQGCWTCRLRKKKCDEGRPHCSTCELLSITCYGFGPKPEWMDNGEKEKSVANSLKEIVKHTSRRKATHQLPKQRDPIIRIASKFSTRSVESSFSGFGTSRQPGVTQPSDQESSQEDGLTNMLHNRSTDLLVAEQGNPQIAESMISISADESVLLMYFLDIVFPLQYPMYKPGILDGGRGWLLALLLRTKSLYHAALALSAYHRRTIMLEKISHMGGVTALVEQERHLEICIKLVNQSAQNSCPKNGLGIVTAVIQLVFFELYTGHGNAWQAHLRAAMNMYKQGYKKDLSRLGLDEKSRTILHENLPHSEYEMEVAEEVVTFRFLGGTMIWLDITSSITAGSAPYLLPYHFCVIASNSQIKLEDIMGCENWVMLQIGRIAELHERINQAIQQGHFDSTKFEPIIGDISKEIQFGLAQSVLEGFTITERDSTTMCNTMSVPSTFVTRIFAYMASIYLHLVTHGFQKLEVLDTIISGAMGMLQTQIATHHLPSLVSPLYVIGCVAKQGSEQFFRNVFSSPPLLDPSIVHRGRILPILEEIWSKRQTTPGLTWNDSLDLTHDLLLL